MNPKRPGGLVVVTLALALTYGHLLGPFDLLTFLHAGRAVLHGHSPYAGPRSAVFVSGHAFVYPLYVAWLFAPLSALPGAVAVPLYLLGSVAAIVVGCRLLGRSGTGAAALLLVSSTTVIALQMGTLNPFLLLGLAAAWHWRDRPLLSGALLGVTVMAKLFLVPVLLWPLLRRRWGQTASAAVTAVGLVLASAALGSLSPAGYVRMMSELDSHEQVASWSLSSFLQGVGLVRGAATAGAVVVATAGAAALWAMRRRLADAQVLGGLVLVSLLVSPIVWSSYLVLLAVPLLLVARGDRLLALFSVASWVLVTPDAASAPRVAAGVLLAVVVALAVAGPSDVPAALRGWARQAPVRSVGLVVAVAGAMVLAPQQARSALPALATIAAVSVWCLRPAAGGVGGLARAPGRPH